MIALVFAMVTLQNAAPDPTVSAAPSLAQRLTGQGPTSPLQSQDAGFGNLTITAGCTYGTPRFSPSFYQNATDLVRPLTQPQCADQDSSISAASAFGPTGFAYALPTSLISTPTSLQTTKLSPVPANTFVMAPREATHPYILQHLALPAEFTTPNGPVTAIHATTPTRTATTIRHPHPQ